VGNLGEK
jgi:hypothetical protein